MFKKVTVATAFSAALLFGGAFQTVDASASLDSSPSQGNISHQNDTSHSGDRYKHYRTFQDFLNHFFDDDDKGDWDTEGKQESNDHSDSDKAEAEQDKQPQAPENTEETQNESNDQSGETEEHNDASADGQLNQFEKEVVSLTNDEREKNGLEPLEADEELSVVARDKSKDMQSSGYFSHESPTYGSPFDMMDDYGISFSTAGENIAHGQRSPEEVVNGWMNSQGHRENILNPNFTHIGVGYVEQGNYWTQEFTGE